MNKQANKIDLTTAAEGTMIMEPWGKLGEQRPVSFTSIEVGEDADGDECWYITYTIDGKSFVVSADSQFATPSL